MARKTTFLCAGALSLALVVACPVVAIADSSSNETVVGVAGAMLTTKSNSNSDEEKDLPAALEGDTEIEKLTIASDKAQANLKKAEDEVARIQTEINEIEEVLPAQQARSDAGVKQRYIMQSNPLAIAEPLLTSQTLDEFIRQVDYLEMVSKSNLEEFNKTCEMKEELDAAKAEQESVRAEANAKVLEAQEELEELQDERAEKQEEGQEKAISQIATESGKKMGDNNKDDSDDEDSDDEDEDEDEDSDDEDSDEDSDDEDDEDSDEDEDEDEDSDDGEAGETASTNSDDLIDGADWHAHRDEFIAEWAERLDDYLEGTALEGQGKNFAASAWKYCIDPRWSAAISNTESSKGEYCIRPHNAWGWGAADSDPYGLASEWDSWEEAIDAHARGLAKGYGYTISMRGAQSYCPNTWQSWYNKTLAEMAKI